MTQIPDKFKGIPQNNYYLVSKIEALIDWAHSVEERLTALKQEDDTAIPTYPIKITEYSDTVVGNAIKVPHVVTSGSGQGGSLGHNPVTGKPVTHIVVTETNTPRWRAEEQIIEIIKRYTHDRSESGYDDIRGACASPCYQCAKDARMIKEVIALLAK